MEMKEKSPLTRVINFSGGRTSGYMTIMEYKPGDIVLFCDTGREHPKTYKFIHDFEAHEGIPVIRTSMFPDQGDSFRALLEKKKFKVIPNRVKRFCTNELKIKTAKRYLRTIGIRKFENLIGFRADEERRVKDRKQKFKKVFDKFPLYEQGINKAMINEYWRTKPYNLEIPAILGNCTLCFMKGKDAIVAILTVYPELAAPWIEDEEKSAQEVKNRGGKKVGSGRRYLEHVTIKTLLQIAQNNLFKDYNLEEISPAYNCACTT